MSSRLAGTFVGLRRVAAGLVLALVLQLSPAHTDDKTLHGVALVIGQSEYENLAALTNPANDAKAIDRLLSDLGFEVDLISNADRKKLNRSLERFVEDAAEADVALIYYSGHGIEAGGENFLVPVDADISALEKADETLVPVAKVLAELQATVPVTIVLLDACRSNPFPAGAMVKLDDGSEVVPVAAGGLGTPRGVVAIGGQDGNNESLGAVIGFAATPGRVALDGDPGGNSPYAAALLKHLAAPGFAFSDVMTMVTEEVFLKTGAQQLPWTNASLRRLLYFGGTAEAEADADQSAIRGERRKLLLTIASLGEVQREQVVAKAKGDGVPMDALFAMLKAVGADTPQDPDQLARLLQDQSQRLKAMLEERDALKNADPEIARLSGLANDAVSEGALETAIEFRQRAKQRVASLSSTVDDAESNLKARRIEFAAVFANSAETYALAYDNARAAEDFAKAFEQVAKWDDALALKYKMKEARALSDLGFNLADTAANRRAIEAYRVAAALAPADKDPAGWADSQSGLAMTIWAMGDRASDAAVLDESVSILKSALSSPALTGKFQQIAQLEADLSLVLMSIGLREAGVETLEEAAVYARKALEVKTRDAAPEEWSRLQNHLGSALLLRSLREQSTERAAEAAVAFRAALEVLTRESDPLAWGNAVNNLGLAIGQIGSREAGTEKLEESVDLLNQALEVRRRDVAPLAWAETYVNLASTYHELGNRAGGDTYWYFEDATALRKAMLEITRERDPLKWAALQDNLGLALGSVGHATGKSEPLRDALRVYELALTERTRQRVPLDWASTMNNIGNIHYRLGEFENDAQAQRKAVAAFNAALEERTRERTPSGWASSNNNLANALSGLGRLESNEDAFRQAVDHYKLALQEYPVETSPIDFSDTQYNMSLVYLALGKLTGKQADFDAARAAIKASHQVYIDAGQRQYDQYFTNLELGVQLAETEWIVKRKQEELANKAKQN